VTARIERPVQLGHAEHAPSGKSFPLSLLAADVTDPANIGGLFRLADALGVRHIYLAGASVTPQTPRVRRTARATQQYVSWSYAQDPVVLVKELKARGQWVVALEITSTSVDVRHVSIPQGAEIVLIVGSENQGVSQSLLDESAQTVHLPMMGHNSSMNLVVASAIAVFEMTKELSAT
jgi:tRNA G18 (ribose-2'-O)-methylase SpoU